MGSLQTRLAIWISLCMAVIVIFSGFLIWYLLRNELVEEFDRSLRGTTETLAGLIEFDGNVIVSEMTEIDLPRFSRTENPDYYQILDANGDSIEQSRRLAGNTLGFRQKVANDRVVFENSTLPGERLGRTAILRFVPRTDPNSDEDVAKEEEVDEEITDEKSGIVGAVTLLVARDRTELDSTLNQFARLIGLVGILTIVVVPLCSVMVSRWGLAPLNRTAANLEQIDIGSLHSKLATEGTPREIQSLVVALNRMLERLQAGYQREKEFSGNVAHELRTPIAGLKSTIEVALSRTREPDEYRRSLQKCLRISNETEAVIGNLLTLARIESGNCSLNCELVSINELIQESWNSGEIDASVCGLTLQLALADLPPVWTDREKIRLVFRNLFENALCHGDWGSEVQVESANGNASITVRVSNQASKLPPNQVARIFDRFWQSGEDRSQTGKHSGIGLPLCQSIIDLLGGEIEARMMNEGRLSLIVTLPVGEGER